MPRWDAASLQAAFLVLALGALWSALAAPAAPEPAPALTPLRAAQFCETSAPFEDSGCQWQHVTLPHRWSVPGDAPRWGLYRFNLAAPGSGALGIVTEHLSLHGSVRVGAQTVTPEAALSSRGVNLRYWPQLYPFTPEPAEAAPRIIDIAVLGHPRTKSGLGALHAGPLQQALVWQERQWMVEVALVLALAGACTVAGSVGLFAGHRSSLVERLLRTVSLLTILAGARTAMNFVVEPWLPWPAWSALGLWLLVAIGALSCAAPIMYLRPNDARVMPATFGALLGLAVALAALPAAWHFELAEALFAALLLLAAVAVAALGWQACRLRDPIGLTLFVPIGLILLSGAHDLALHLGSASLSDRYLQKWSAPALLVVMVVLLARRASTQQAMEQALQHETARRQELLRDLHDGIGSRLVALSYHARQQASQAELVEEIDGLTRELQLIQGAVRAEPTSLEMLVADLRHLYARVGGGNLPIQWQVSEPARTIALGAEQAVATARILEEAVANAMKHAPGSTITVSLGPGPGTDTATLEIRDGGPGRFREGAGAGLLHMRQRAAAAGLELQLIQPAHDCAGKAVQLTFAAPPLPARGPKAWLSRIWNSVVGPAAAGK